MFGGGSGAVIFSKQLILVFVHHVREVQLVFALLLFSPGTLPFSIRRTREHADI